MKKWQAVSSEASPPRRSCVLANRSAMIPAVEPGEFAGAPVGATDLLLTEGSEVSSIGNQGESMSKPNDLVQGTLDLLLLKLLALQPLNGWAISQRLTQLSSDVLQVSDGSLYPALHKLEQEGWVTAEWRASENNRRAKFYSLTRAGRKQLELEAGNWRRLSAAITQVVRLREA